MEHVVDSKLTNDSNLNAIIKAIKEDTALAESDLQAIRLRINKVIFWDNNTLLMYAVEYNRKSIVQQLISLGADVNQGNTHRITPLMIAAQTGNRQMVELLLSFKADPTVIRLGMRQTAAQMAAEKGYQELAYLLKSEESKFRKL